MAITAMPIGVLKNDFDSGAIAVPCCESQVTRLPIVLEVVRGVADAIGADRTGIRLSPWSTFNDMAHFPETDETFGYLAEELQKIVRGQPPLSPAIARRLLSGRICQPQSSTATRTSPHHTLQHICHSIRYAFRN